MSFDNAVLGRHIRDLRTARGQSVRGLAAQAGISAAYLTSLERGRNPTTGRPPVPSLDVVGRLADALGVELDELVRPGAVRPAGNHVLAYVLQPPAAGLIAALDGVFGDDLDHWLHIADPRGGPADDPDRCTTIRFTLGAAPYATPEDLDGDALLEAVDEAVSDMAPRQAGARVGLVIADCSAVMRYLRDAAAEVDLELRWHAAVEQIWARHMGRSPIVDVCAYDHADIAALGLTIDQLATALSLVARHDRVLVIDGDDCITGEPAVRTILERARPAGTSPDAWRQLTAAAARGLAAA